MKRIKRLASLLLAMVMVLAMSVTAFAAGGDTPDPQPGEGEGTPAVVTQYELFQIFTGQFVEGKLSNAKWGQNGQDGRTDPVTSVKEGDLVASEILKELSDVNANADDTVKLQTITKYANLNSPALKGIDDQPDANEDGSYTYSGLASGYYLIRGKAGSTDGTDEAYTLYVVQVIGGGLTNSDGSVTDTGDGTLTFRPKRNGVPTPDKKVKDKNDTTGNASEWQGSADHDINDVIDYQLSATLPDAETMAAYQTYKLTFEDTLSKALDYVYTSEFADGVTVKVNGTEVSDGYTVTYDGPTGDTTTTNENDRHLVITFNDVKASPVNAAGGAEITVEYQAKLNANANIGAAGNLNTLVLKYSNDPNHSGAGDPPNGTTPPKTAIVFTFKTIVNKVDGDESPLAGAAFTLAKLVNGTWTDVQTIDVNADGTTTFNFTGLDDGRYMLTETKTPAGFNSIDPIYFEVVATHEPKDDGTGDELISLVVRATDENGIELTGENVTEFSVDMPSGTASTNVVNNAGAVLPSTGGIGTTIFYVVGGILVVGAGILLVTKKRMSAR